MCPEARMVVADVIILWGERVFAQYLKVPSGEKSVTPEEGGEGRSGELLEFWASGCG